MRNDPEGDVRHDVILFYVALVAATEYRASHVSVR